MNSIWHDLSYKEKEKILSVLPANSQLIKVELEKGGILKRINYRRVRIYWINNNEQFCTVINSKA